MVHLADREPMGGVERATCSRLCDMYERQATLSPTYEQLYRRQIDKTCSPRDAYLGCLYSTTRFAVLDQP